MLSFLPQSPVTWRNILRQSAQPTYFFVLLTCNSSYQHHMCIPFLFWSPLRGPLGTVHGLEVTFTTVAAPLAGFLADASWSHQGGTSVSFYHLATQHNCQALQL